MIGTNTSSSVVLLPVSSLGSSPGSALLPVTPAAPPPVDGPSVVASGPAEEDPVVTDPPDEPAVQSSSGQSPRPGSGQSGMHAPRQAAVTRQKARKARQK